MTTTLHKARKHRLCDGYRCPHAIAPGELYVRHATFPGEEGHEEGSAPVVHAECAACVNERGSWVELRYGVPAMLGGRVTFDGTPGTIVNFTNGHLLVRTDDGRVVPIHPKWNVTYEEAS